MIFSRRTFRPRASRTETAVTIGCVILLIGIGMWFQSRARRADPDLFRLDDRHLVGAGPAPQLYRRLPITLASEPLQVDAMTPVLSAPPAGLRLDGRVESFGPDTLYEKIDGRESLYKAYAFRRLWTASYAAPSGRIDVEVFQHGTEADALGVLSVERQGVAGGRHEADRTTTPNGIFRVVGTLYVRVFGTSDTDLVRADAARLSDHVAAAVAPGAGRPAAVASPRPGARVAPAPTSTGATSELGAMLAEPDRWTPTHNPLVLLGADPTTIEFTPENGLGIGAFTRLFLGAVPDGGERVKTFVLAKGDPAAARAAVETYREQMTRAGAPVALPWPTARPPHLTAVKVELLGTVEAAMPVGRLVVGVTDAAGPDIAARVLARTLSALERATTERSGKP